MADLTTNIMVVLRYGTLKEQARLVNVLMNRDNMLGKAIYEAACFYAHEHIEAKEREEINAAASAFAQKKKMNSAG